MNWLHYTLQFGLGLLVGAFLGCGFLGRSAFVWISPDWKWTWIAGAALIGAALVSYHGDNLWMGRHANHPEGPIHSRLSVGVSLVSGVIGAGLIVVALIGHFSS